ncbi:MAG: cysteine desulfurase [Dehalococcoidia bacterium]|nr:cysteine desulfurase [Dehalococcoidia bacterium]
MARQVYLDHASAMPVLPEVVEAMLPYFSEAYGNPLSIHNWGDRVRQAVEEARARTASLIGVTRPEEIIFTSSGTESNNMAIKGIALGRQDRGRHIVVSAIEHFSVLHSARTLQKSGFEVTVVPVDRNGVVNPDDVAKSLRSDTVLVSVMHANSEVGTLQPIKEIAQKVKQAGAIFHTDAVATTGTVPVNVAELGVDALSMAANQFYGPKGAAALWVRRGIRLLPLLDGGVQEDGRRPGTENVPAIVGMGKAAELARNEMAQRLARFTALRDRVIKGVLDKIPYTILTGHPTQRLPHHASFCVEFIEGEAMLMLLSSQGIAVSSGSACTSRALKASHVLIAMGLPHEIAQGSLVCTVGLDTSEADIDYFTETLPPIVTRLRAMSPLWAKHLKQGKGG